MLTEVWANLWGKSGQNFDRNKFGHKLDKVFDRTSDNFREQIRQALDKIPTKFGQHLDKLWTKKGTIFGQGTNFRTSLALGKQNLEKFVLHAF